MFLQEMREEARKSGGHKKAVKGASDMREGQKRLELVVNTLFATCTIHKKAVKDKKL